MNLNVLHGIPEYYAKDSEFLEYIKVFDDLGLKYKQELEILYDYIDVMACPERLLKYKLYDLGWGLDLELTENETRRLIPLIKYIYQKKGTNEGIIETIRALLGIDVIIKTTNDIDSGLIWIMGESEIGVDTYFGMEDRDGNYIVVEADRPLTEVEESNITKIVNYMRKATVWFYVDYPGKPDPKLPPHWIMDVTRIGEDDCMFGIDDILDTYHYHTPDI